MARQNIKKRLEERRALVASVKADTAMARTIGQDLLRVEKVRAATTPFSRRGNGRRFPKPDIFGPGSPLRPELKRKRKLK